MVAKTSKPLREELSIRAYAKRAGVSHTAVRMAIAGGRLTKRCLVRRGKRIKVVAHIADREWAQNTDPLKQREREERAGGVPKGTEPANKGKRRQRGLYGDVIEEAVDGPPTADEKPINGEAETPKGSAMHEVRVGYVSLQAQLAQLDLDEKQGKLVRAAEVQATIFKLARDVQTSLLLIPNRLAPLLAAETDPHAIRQMLTDEIIQALEALAGVQGSSGG